MIGILVPLAIALFGISAAGDTVATSSPSGAVQVVQTDNNGSRLTQLPSIPFSTGQAAFARTQTVIYVNDAIRYQAFHGVGAALTNSSAYLLMGRLPYRIGRQVIQDAFGAAGMNAGYTRVSIGGSDFNQNGTAFTEDDMPPGTTDPGLQHFSIAHDQLVIQALRLALAYHPGLRILASPWSAPAWMKTSGLLSNVYGTGQLEPLDYGVYARYLVKWLLAYKRAGVPIYAISPQNEPNTWTSYPGGELSDQQEATIVDDYLRPDLRAAGLATQIYVGDASWDYERWTERVISATGGAAGAFWHCYTGSPLEMTRLHDLYPKTDQILSECALNLVREPGSQLVIEAARNWASGVNFWNLVLDRAGGPKAPHDTNCNGCIGSVTFNGAADSSGSPQAAIDVTSGRVTYNGEFYELGQTGYFLQPGARRIYSSHEVQYDPASNSETAGVDNVAFANPDGSIMLEAFNNTLHELKVGVRAGSVSFAFTIPGRATDTLFWRPAS